jgi:glycosyltransferase involved in cell wall biosynthesis
MRLKLEGWRGIPHSYALVNQYLLLELQKRPGISLFHRDLPFFNPRWETQKGTSGFDAAAAAALASIAPPDGPVDVTLRSCYPHDAGADGTARVFALATCEFDRLLPGAMGPMDPASQFVTPSHWSKRGLVASGLDPGKVHVVPHGVDPAIFHPPSEQARNEMRAWFGIGADEFLFLNVSSLAPNKGIDTLLMAFARVHRHHPEAVLLLKDHQSLYGLSGADILGIMGPALGPARHAVRTFSDDLSLARLAALYGAADAYVSPYRAEGFNLPPLEAAACGVPIAVTAGGPTDDYAQPAFALKIAARRVRDHDQTVLEPELDSLVDAMLRLAGRRAPELDMPAGVKWIGENFTWKQAVDRLLTVVAA